MHPGGVGDVGPDVPGHDGDRTRHPFVEVDDGEVEDELDGERARRSHPSHVARPDRDRRREGLAGEVLEGEDHILGGQWLPVVPTHVLTQLDGVGQPVVGAAGHLRGQPGVEPPCDVVPQQGVVDQDHVAVARRQEVVERRRERGQAASCHPDGGPARLGGLASGVVRPRAPTEHQRTGGAQPSSQERSSVHRHVRSSCSRSASRHGGVSEVAAAVRGPHRPLLQRGLKTGSSPTERRANPRMAAVMARPAGRTHHVHSGV